MRVPCRFDDLSGCSEGIRHGPADRYGRCPWCKTKYTYGAGRYLPEIRSWRSDLDDAYDRQWNPDWGSGRFDSDPRGASRVWP